MECSFEASNFSTLILSFQQLVLDVHTLSLSGLPYLLSVCLPFSRTYISLPPLIENT
jgi:hypothetical protein